MIVSPTPTQPQPEPEREVKPEEKKVKSTPIRRRTGETPVALFVEAGGDGFDGAGQEIVVVGHRQGEARFYCIELSEHKKKAEKLTN